MITSLHYTFIFSPSSSSSSISQKNSLMTYICVSRLRKFLRDFHFCSDSSKRITSISVKFSYARISYLLPIFLYIYICMLVSLRFESSRCMNILIAFDCAAINVEYEYEMSVKNQRCPTGMISEFLASVSLINGRVTDTTSR